MAPLENTVAEMKAFAFVADTVGGATLAGGQERTMMKIVVDAATDRVLGVHILGEGAGEMAQLLGIALKMGATKADFDATMAVHPTAAEELVTMRSPTTRHRR